MSPVAHRATRKVYLRIVLPLFVTSIIAYLDRVNLSYAALTMNEDLGFSDEVFGIGAGIFFAGYVLFEIPGALIAERYSPKWWLARIMISWGAISGLLAFVTTVWQFYLLRFLLGIAEASLYPVLYASCIPRWFRARDRARAIAILLTSLQLSGIIGAPLAGWLLGIEWMGLKGWQCLFLLEAIPAVLFAFVLVFCMADSPEQATWLSNEERAYLVAQQAEDVAQRGNLPRYTLWQALTNAEVVRLCVIYYLWLTGYWGFNYWMPSVLKSASGWSNIAVGWMIVIPMCLSLAFMIFIGDSSSRSGEKRWHGAIGLFIAAIGMFVGTMTERPAIAFAMMCVTAIGVYAPFGVWWSYPTTFLSGSAAAGAIGLINSLGNLGGFCGPYLTGKLKESTGSFQSAWWFLGTSLFVAGLLMLTLKQNVDARAKG
ncbi:MAG: MFS transporter [Planctomycetales bacterium]|nr:MFS transporter [Planctomycetales bacterium]